MRIKVFVVEDHLVVQLGWERLLDSGQFEIVGQVASASQALSEIKLHSPDVLLLDVRLRDGIAFRTLRDHLSIIKATPTVVMTAFDNPTYIAQAIALGAVDAHSKAESKSEIEDAIRAAVEKRGPTGLRFVTIRNFLHNTARFREHGLSRRETQVLRHLAYGLSNYEIASSIGVVEDTVKEHVRNIYRKLDIKDRAAAAVWAINHLLKATAM